MDCDECIEDEAEVHRLPDCEGCPVTGVHLEAANQRAWAVYQEVGDQARFHFGGIGPLDFGAIIAWIERAGLAPDSPEEWRELLRKLRVIHAARLEVMAAQNKSDAEEPDPDDGQ